MELYRLNENNRPVQAWLWLAVLQEIAPVKWDEAELWAIDCPAHKTRTLKKTLRKKLGMKFYRVKHRNLEYPVTINPLHIPDANKLSEEWNILKTYLHY